MAGGVATGKTSLRREEYSTGYVVLDVAEIFLSLCQGEYLDFPDGLEEPMNWIGYGVAQRIVRERSNFVTEIIDGDVALVTQLMESIKGVGYQTHLAWITCDTAVAMERNANRGKNNISAYYTEHYHRQWILDTLVSDAS